MYQVDNETGDIVIAGFEQGIGDSPYTGLTDMRNISPLSVPGEADINFKTTNIASGSISGSITSVSGTVATYTTTGTSATLEGNVAIYFTGKGALSGFSTATPYWVAANAISSSTMAVFTDFNQTSFVNFTGSGTAATFVAYQVNVKPSYVVGGVAGGATGVQGIQYFAQPTNLQDQYLTGNFTFGVDGFGQVWGNLRTTNGQAGMVANNFWTYTGNSIQDGSNNSNASGNGLVYWRVTNGATGASSKGADYLFVFRNSQIDYMIVQQNNASLTTGVWTSGWVPATVGGAIGGTTGSSNYLTLGPGTNGSHAAIVGYDNRVYFCDGPNIQKFFQTTLGTPNNPGTIFNPTDTTTYTATTYNILPVNDLAQCLSPLGTNILIGSQGNLVYVWNTTSNLTSYYIPVAESFIAKIVTLNTNAYIFAGNTGIIYITNGSQAQVWKKIPDHLTNTIAPLYTWAGATVTKNQLCFSFNVVKNDGTALTTPIGGIYAIDVNTKALRGINRLSFGSYNGYASALLPQIYNPEANSNPAGIALWTGWYDAGNTNWGIDIPSSQVYSAGEAYVISDLIPIGTAFMPITPAQVEFKLSSPLLSSEKVQLLTNSHLNGPFTSQVTISGDGALVSGNSNSSSVQKQQWISIKAVLTGKTSSPSFNRLTQLRIIGATAPIKSFQSIV